MDMLTQNDNLPPAKDMKHSLLGLVDEGSAPHQPSLACGHMNFMYVLRVFFYDIFTHCICAVNDMLYRAAIYCSFPHSRSPPSSARFGKYFPKPYKETKGFPWYVSPPKTTPLIMPTLWNTAFIPLFRLGPQPALPRARRGGGAPSAQVTSHSQLPMIADPMC